MSSFSEHVLQEKLSRLSASQDSIETLSSWIIHHRTHASISVTKWLQNVHQGDCERRLVLLYLANDVLQNSRRKNISVFHDLFKEPLKYAASLTITSNPKVQGSFMRIINIWRERRVYENPFLNELESLIEPIKEEKNEVKPDPEPTDFKLSLLEDSLTELQKFESELKVKFNALQRQTIDVSSTSSLTQLKDKSAGGKFQSEFEDASMRLQDYCESIGIEVSERKGLVGMLEQCNNYHLAKTKELRGLLSDYGNIKSHFEKVRQKLKERVEQLEKAAHTATSDPSSKQDITVAGDMEIDSDNESQEETIGPSFHSSQISLPQAPPSAPPPLVPPPMQPDLIMPPVPPHPSAPPHAFPSLPRFPPAGGFPPYPIPPSPNQQLPPQPRPPSALPTAPPPFPPIPYSPSMPKPFTPRLSIPSSLPPLPPPPFSPTIQDHPSPEEKGVVIDRHVMMARLNSEIIPKNNDHTSPMTGNVPSLPQRHLPTITSSSPVPSVTPVPIMYSSSSSTHTPPSQGEDPLRPPPTLQDNTPLSSSIDDRLKNLVNQKTLPLSLFQDYSDSDSDEGENSNKPYSPTAIPALDQPNLKEEEDKESLPTPNMSPTTPEYVNFPTDKPIIATSKSTPTMHYVPPTLATPNSNNNLVSATPTNHSISRTFVSSDNSVSFNPGPVVSLSGNQPPRIDKALSLSKAVMDLSSSISNSSSDDSSNPAKAINPEKIKITPTLTTLLDKIFPQLSQSLQSERKRKLESPNNAPPQKESDTKAPRLESPETINNPGGVVQSADKKADSVPTVLLETNDFPKTSANNMSFRTFPVQYRPELNTRPFLSGGEPMAPPPSSIQLPRPNFRPPHVPNFQMNPTSQRFQRPGPPPPRLPPLPLHNGGRPPPPRFYQNQAPPHPHYY